MALAGFGLSGRPFGVWPATLQVMPEGILDAAFGRLFVGARVTNGSAQAWPAAEVRISPRGLQLLTAGRISVSNDWSGGDASAVGQSASSEWIPVPALAAGGVQIVFFKLDLSKATTGLQLLELELREVAAPANALRASAPLPIARTTCHGAQHTFSTVCDQGTLTAAVSALTLDQELFRRALRKARVVGALGAALRTPAETERLRQRLRGLFCGDESDVCAVLSDASTSCALPSGTLPRLVPPVGGGAVLILSDQAANLADRVKVLGGSVFSNNSAAIGNDALVNGDVGARANVQIGDRTRVEGDVTAGGVITRSPSGGSVIAGEQNERTLLPPIAIPTKTISAGTANITVNSGTGTASNPFAIAPGKYANIVVNSNNVIALAPGLYQVEQFVINADVSLKLNQSASAVDLRVKTSLSLGDRLIVNPGTPAAGVVAQFYSSQTTEVRVGTDIVSFPIALTVPAGTIHVFSRTNLGAALSAKTVTLEPDVTVGSGSVSTSSSDWVGTGSSGLEFLGYPTGVQYAVDYPGGFFGSTGPLALGSLSWKALLASAMLQLDLALPGAVGHELVTLADQAVVGSVVKSVLNAPTLAPGTPPTSTQAGSVDAALANVRGNRSLGAPLFAQLDAAPGEANATPIEALGGTFTALGLLSNAEIDAALSSGVAANLRVHKSGAGSGVTRGILSALLPVATRDDATGTLHFVNQLLIVPDPLAPAAEGKLAVLGDSGALWVQTSSKKIIGLTHTVGNTGVVASRIQDVVNALQVQLA
jgi:hypothetical protein